MFWSSRPAFPVSAFRPGVDYVLTDFRVIVRNHAEIVQEIALDDIGAVGLDETWYQRLAATSTVRIHSKRPGHSLVIANIHHGPQLALILQLLATDRFGAGLDPGFVAAALGPGAPPLFRPHLGWI